MTEPDRSAPLSVEQDGYWCMFCKTMLRLEETYLHDRRSHLITKIPAAALSAAHAEGVRTGRRQALEEAAQQMDSTTAFWDGREWSHVSEQWTRKDIRNWLLFRATCGDEAHRAG